MHRRDFLALGASVALLPSTGFAQRRIHQATGLKVGEVGPESAIVWMRLTKEAERKADGIVRHGGPAPFPPELRMTQLEGSTPGLAGMVRLRYATNDRLRGAVETDWVEITADTDFAHQFRLSGLKPATRYYYVAETSDGGQHAPLRGVFRTPPEPNDVAEVTFAMMTCQKYSELDHAEGFHIYESMRRLTPDLYITAGDIVYYDSDDPRATSIELARYHWQRMYSLPRHRRLLLEVPGYWLKDDHDTLFNDAWPGRDPVEMLPLTWNDGLRIFREQVPMGEKTYRTFRWGRALQIWLVEGRDFRSPNNSPDGPNKSIWGAEQKRWLQASLLASDADWKLLINPTPIVGPDRVKKGDNHANEAFRYEGDEFRAWVQKHLGDRFFNLNGDRHWQYHSVHPESKVQEFSAGPASDSHAAGSPGEDKRYHRFHRVKGGFLTVTVRRDGRQSSIWFRHHDVHGRVVYEYTQSAAV